MPGAITEGSKTPNVRAADSSMLSSAGDGESAVSPKAKKRSWNTVARAAAFRRRREQGSETPNLRAADSSMPSSAAAFRRRREQGSETPL